MVGELWAFTCWAATPAGEYENLDWGQARLFKAVVPVNTDMGVSMGVEQARLS